MELAARIKFLFHLSGLPLLGYVWIEDFGGEGRGGRDFGGMKCASIPFVWISLWRGGLRV